VRGTVVLMPLDPFPVNLDRQPKDFCSDVCKQIIVWTRKRQGSVL
jgi:predicted nucleic acid-binding Zn ribbon protein